MPNWIGLILSILGILGGALTVFNLVEERVRKHNENEAAKHATIELLKQDPPYIQPFTHFEHPFPIVFNVKVRNSSSTAIAKNIKVFFDGMLFNQHPGSYENPDVLSDLQPGQAVVVKFTQKVSPVRNIKVACEDNIDQYESPSYQYEALPDF